MCKVLTLITVGIFVCVGSLYVVWGLCNRVKDQHTTERYEENCEDFYEDSYEDFYEKK